MLNVINQINQSLNVLQPVELWSAVFAPRLPWQPQFLGSTDELFLPRWTHAPQQHAKRYVFLLAVSNSPIQLVTDTTGQKLKTYADSYLHNLCHNNIDPDKLA